MDGLTPEEIRKMKQAAQGKPITGGISPSEIKSLGRTPKPTPMKRDAVISPETSHLADSAFTSESELKPGPSWLDGILGSVLRVGTQGAAIGGGALAGGAISGGNPAGVILGGAAGNEAYHLGQDAGQKLGGGTEVWGQAPQGVVNRLQEDFLQSALDLGGGKVATALSGLARKGAGGFLSNFFNKNTRLSPEDVKAIEANPDVPMTVGQATGNNVANFMEDVFATGKKQSKFIDPAQDLFKKKAIDIGRNISGTPIDYTQQNVGELMSSRASRTAGARKVALQKKIDTTYEGLRNGFSKNGDVEKVIITEPNDGPALYAPGGPEGKGVQINSTKQTIRDIEGPIYLKRSHDFASRFSTMLDERIAELKAEGMPDEMVSKLFSAKSILTPIVNAPKTLAKGMETPVLPWDDVKDLSSVSYKIWKTLKDSDEITKKKFAGMAGSLGDLLTADKKLSITGDSSIGTNGWSQGSRKAIDKAERLHKAKLARFNGKMVKDLVNEGADVDVIQEKIMDQALTTPEQARKYMMAVGGKTDEAGRELATKFITDQFVAAEKGGHFYGTNFLDALKAKGDMFRTVMSSSQRQAVEYLGRVMEHISPETSNAGKYSVYFRQGSFILSGALGASAGLTGGDGGGDMLKGAALGIALPMSAKRFVNKVLLDPERARKFAVLARTPPDSPKAKLLVQSIFGPGKYGKIARGGVNLMRDFGAEIIGGHDATPEGEQE
jgi:hypothetical protein